MTPIAANTLLDNLRWRYATKRFEPSKKIPEATWAALEEAMVLAPSSFGMQPWKFVVVRSTGLREKLRQAAWNQPQVTEASHLVVFCRKTQVTLADVDRLIDRVSAVRGVPRPALDGFRGMIAGFVQNPPPGFDAQAWTARQVYIALGFFLSAAAQMGIDACPMEGFDAPSFDQILGLTGSGYAATVMATAGYRAAIDELASAKKVRFDAAEVILRM
jgi:nitroreductase